MPLIKEDPKVDTNICKKIIPTVETYSEHDWQRSGISDVTTS